ncbi:major facilitator superfamily domain-containing protein [Trichoderma austrokoningii]
MGIIQVGKADKDESESPTSKNYSGEGTDSNPYIVEFQFEDPGNAMNFSPAKKWFIIFIVTLSVFSVTLTSSAYSGSATEVVKQFHCSSEIFALGISLYVLGFAIGPALWAPLSELYGRRILFITTHTCMVAFVAGSVGANSMATLLIFRFLTGMFGASPLTNSGGVIADMFPATQRGLAMILFCAAPFMGPVLGPIIGGFISMNVGWRWVQGVCSIFIGVVWIVGSIFVPETYGPVILRKRAEKLSEETNNTYKTIFQQRHSTLTSSEIFRKALMRPWILLFREPIVLIAATYLAILYGTVYMFMPALAIVFQRDRGWSEGVGGLAFLGLVCGMLVGIVYAIIDDNRYKRLGKAATPESRLPPAAVGSIALPIGLFAFAWTNSPSIHWSASIILSAPFGFGCVLVFLSCLNYLIDAYTIYAASVLGAAAMIRAFFGTAFPLFTDQMYEGIGIHWASTIPGFLTLICVPFPFVMLKYGEMLRLKCKYALEAATLMAQLHREASTGSTSDEETLGASTRTLSDESPA